MSAPIIIPMSWRPPDMPVGGVYTVSGPPPGSAPLPEYWNAAVHEALCADAEWIFFVDPREEPHPRAASFLEPAATAYEAVWGGLSIEGEVPKKARYTCDDYLDAVHMALVWWVGRSHFVRTRVAADIGFTEDDGWFARYFLDLWQRFRCLKTAQPMTAGPDDLRAWSSAEREVVTTALAEDPQYILFNHQGETVQLPYTGLNPAVERTQMRGLFFEQKDLDALGELVPPRAAIVDVGANTGNHTLYFAKILKAARVMPFEPNPAAIPFLKRTVAQNDLHNVDLSNLGMGLGSDTAELALQTGRRGHLGTVRLAPGEGRTVPVRRLDDMILEPVDFIKIDVENMEIDVLRGARKLFNVHRPLAFVEVQDTNMSAFLAILNELGYAVRRIFADEGYANYLIGPEEDH